MRARTRGLTVAQYTGSSKDRSFPCQPHFVSLCSFVLAPAGLQTNPLTSGGPTKYTATAYTYSLRPGRPQTGTSLEYVCSLEYAHYTLYAH
eukprot:5366685-Prymnesium_polylepis.1